MGRQEHDFLLLKIICSSQKNKLSDINNTHINIGLGQKFELLDCFLMYSDIFREKPLSPDGLKIIQSRLQQTCDFFIFETQVFEVCKKPIVAIKAIKQLIFKNKK